MARNLADQFDPALIDISKYKELFFRAAYEVLQLLGVAENILRDWLLSRASYIAPDVCTSNRELPLFANIKHFIADVV